VQWSAGLHRPVSAPILADCRVLRVFRFGEAGVLQSATPWCRLGHPRIARQFVYRTTAGLSSLVTFARLDEMCHLSELLEPHMILMWRVR